MHWEPIEYRLTGSDPLVYCQWDGLRSKWFVSDVGDRMETKWFDTLEEAKAYGELNAVAEDDDEDDDTQIFTDLESELDAAFRIVDTPN